MLVLLVGSVPACKSKSLECQLAQQTGTLKGGNKIAIIGEDFLNHGPVVVYIGQLAAKGVVIHQQDLITVRVPKATVSESAEVEVRLAFADGSTCVPPQHYRYSKP